MLFLLESIIACALFTLIGMVLAIPAALIAGVIVIL